MQLWRDKKTKNKEKVKDTEDPIRKYDTISIKLVTKMRQTQHFRRQWLRMY